VRLGVLLAILLAAVGCGGGAGTPPAPRPAPPGRAAAEAAPSGPLRATLRAPLAYEVARYDSLTYSGPGAGPPQISGKLGVLSVRQAGSHLEITLDSLEAAPGSRLSRPAADSAVGARWQGPLSSTGAAGPLTATRRTITAEQMGEIARLLLPSLPKDGRSADSWSDSSSYAIQMDAFDAVESAAGRSRAAPIAKERGAGLAVTVEQQLTRTGHATQAGQEMTMKAAGRRLVTYELGPDGWVRSLAGRDSLEIRVTVSVTGQVIPVQWRTNFSARLRAPGGR